jgi:hypothetical protein
MANTTVTLHEPIEGPGPSKDQPTVQIKQIVLRQPKYRDMMLLGEPAAFARSEGGIMFSSEKDEIIQAYIERLLVEPKDTQLLEQLGLADTIQCREAVFDFSRPRGGYSRPRRRSNDFRSARADDRGSPGTQPR